MCHQFILYNILLNPLTWDHHWFLQWGLYTLILSNVSLNQVTIKVVIGYIMKHVKKYEWSRWNLSLSSIESMISLGPSRKVDWEMHGRAIWLIVNHMKNQSNFGMRNQILYYTKLTHILFWVQSWYQVIKGLT